MPPKRTSSGRCPQFYHVAPDGAREPYSVEDCKVRDRHSRRRRRRRHSLLLPPREERMLTRPPLGSTALSFALLSEDCWLEQAISAARLRGQPSVRVPAPTNVHAVCLLPVRVSDQCEARALVRRGRWRT